MRHATLKGNARHATHTSNARHVRHATHARNAHHHVFYQVLQSNRCSNVKQCTAVLYQVHRRLERASKKQRCARRRCGLHECSAPKQPACKDTRYESQYCDNQAGPDRDAPGLLHLLHQKTLGEKRMWLPSRNPTCHRTTMTGHSSGNMRVVAILV